MVKIIEMRLPIEYFEKDRDNRLEARLAKFDLKKGDIIRKTFLPVDFLTRKSRTFIR